MRLLLPLIFALSVSGSAFAKTPPEVLNPYKLYKQALEKDDKEDAKKYALKAWEAAEEALGDHKTTGDLAMNYASIGLTGSEKNRSKDYKKRVEAFERAIDLSKLYPEETAKHTEVERLIAKTELELSVSKRGKVGKRSHVDRLDKLITDYGMTGTTFDGDKQVLFARFYELNEKPEQSVQHSEKAIQIYENRTDKLFSKYEYFVRIFKGNSLRNLDQKIDAALEYQVVMQNLEGDLPSEHPFIKSAFSKWMQTRSDIEEAGMLELAEQEGLCECWPFEDFKNQPVPIDRVPPKMPKKATKSGHVYVQFDLDPAGKPINPRKVSSTDSVFEASALKSVEKWKYMSLTDEADPEARKNIVTRISFKLTDRNGDLIPE